MSFEQLINTCILWLTTAGVKILIVLIALYFGFKVIKKIVTGMNILLDKRNVDVTLKSFLDGLVGISLKALLIVMLLGYIGFESASLAAVFASLGLAIGFALQGSLSNFAGGVLILLMRPFKVDDYIEVSGYSGTVEKIKMVYTHLLTPDNKEILIPNGTLANSAITNYSSKELRRVDLTFSCSYNDDVIKVRRVLQEIISKEALILKTPEAFIGISAHGDSAVNFVVRAWVKNDDYWTVHFNLLEQVKIKFDEENISIPFPQIDVNISK